MRLADRIATAEVSFSSYIIAASSTMFGLLIFFIILLSDVEDKNPFVTGLFIGALPWSGLLTLGGVLTIWGLLKRSEALIRAGAILAFFMWGFAAVSFGSIGSIDTLLVVVLPDMTYFGYLYLVASLKTFDRLKEKK